MWRLTRFVWIRSNDHNVPRLASSLAFYTILSLIPFLALVVRWVGVFLWKTQIGMRSIANLFGAEGAQEVLSLIEDIATRPTKSGITALGAAFFFFGAMSALSELQDGLDLIWGIPRKEGTLHFLRRRAATIFTGAFVSFLLFVFIGISATIDGYVATFGQNPALKFITIVANAGASWLLMGCLLAGLFRTLPSAHVSWAKIWAAAAISSLLFTIGKLFFSVYLSHSALQSIFGPAGSFAVVLLWVYISSFLVYMGVEISEAVFKNHLKT